MIFSTRDGHAFSGIDMVVPVARAAARGVALGGEAGLGPRGGRHFARAGRATRPTSGPSPVDRARPGSEHHVLTEGGGIPLAVLLTGGNRRRRHRPGIPAGRGAERARQAGSTPPTPEDGLRRPRLRPRQVPPTPARQGNYPSDRPSRRTPRLRPGHRPLGRGAHDRLAPRHETPTHPLGTTRRHARSTPRPRHLHHLLPTRPTILLGPVRGHLIYFWVCISVLRRSFRQVWVDSPVRTRLIMLVIAQWTMVRERCGRVS